MIETSRLILRPHTLADYEASYTMHADPLIRKFVADGKPIEREEAWHRLMRNAGHWSLLGYGLFAVFEKDSGRFVGETGLADFHRGFDDRFDPFPEAAWMFAGIAHGKGYATEAALAAHQWLDDNRAPPRTVCIIDAANVASVRVGDKLGYRPFGETIYKGDTVILYERLRPAR